MLVQCVPLQSPRTLTLGGHSRMLSWHPPIGHFTWVMGQGGQVNSKAGHSPPWPTTADPLEPCESWHCSSPAANAARSSTAAAEREAAMSAPTMRYWPLVALL